MSFLASSTWRRGSTAWPRECGSSRRTAASRAPDRCGRSQLMSRNCGTSCDTPSPTPRCPRQRASIRRSDCHSDSSHWAPSPPTWPGSCKLAPRTLVTLRKEEEHAPCCEECCCEQHAAAAERSRRQRPVTQSPASRLSRRAPARSCAPRPAVRRTGHLVRQLVAGDHDAGAGHQRSPALVRSRASRRWRSTQVGARRAARAERAR